MKLAFVFVSLALRFLTWITNLSLSRGRNNLVRCRSYYIRIASRKLSTISTLRDASSYATVRSAVRRRPLDRPAWYYKEQRVARAPSKVAMLRGAPPYAGVRSAVRRRPLGQPAWYYRKQRVATRSARRTAPARIQRIRDSQESAT